MQNRYDFIYLFDVKDGNPNGDPDAGNLPRVDAETGHGLVTDVCLKRKVRNFVGLANGERPPYEIYVKERSVLNAQHGRAYDESKKVKEIIEGWENYETYKEAIKEWRKKKKKDGEPATVTKPEMTMVDAARQWVCDNFFDVRTFGAVMSTGDKSEDSGKVERKAGQVRGPVQLTFGRSIDPVVTLEHALTVCAARKSDKPIEGQIGIQGRKFTIPYGLYRTHGFISAPLAAQTGFSDDDLKLLWKALEQMFEHDHSAARGQMSARGLLLFKHDDRLGNAPAHALFDRVSIERTDIDKPARDFSDYRILFDGSPINDVVALGAEKALGNGVALIRQI